jgi:hypothetical protein
LPHVPRAASPEEIDKALPNPDNRRRRKTSLNPNRVLSLDGLGRVGEFDFS